MAIKKSELYSSLWASCDALRGGMELEAKHQQRTVLEMIYPKYLSAFKYDSAIRKGLHHQLPSSCWQGDDLAQVSSVGTNNDCF